VALANWAVKNGIKNVVTIVADYAPGHETEGFFINAYKEAGGTVLESIRVPLSATDFSPFFERAREKKPDAVFGFAPNSVAEVNTWAARLKPAGIKLLATNEITEAEAVGYNRDGAGVISGSHYTETNMSPMNQKFREELVKMFGKDAIPDQFSIGAYDGMHLIYEIVRKLGPRPNPDAVMKFVQGMSFDSPRGRLVLGDDRDAINDVDIRRLEERDGKLVNITIDTIKAVKPVK
jgi:branched-chain amino acid transport system substrate-binding protein